MDKQDFIRKNINQIIMLNEDEFSYYYDLLSFKTFKKKENLLNPGKLSSNAFFILKGCIRYFNIIDAEEYTGQFFIEGNWYTDYASFLFQTPTEQTIQCIEETKVAILSRNSLYHLYDKIPKFERFGRLMAETAYLGLRKRTESHIQLSALERYKELVNERPEIVRRVPQKHIANYLGIKPQSLSRIRKTINFNG